MKRSAFEILSRDGVDFNKLRSIWNNIPLASEDEEEQLEIGAHYLGYMEKQEADIIAFRKDENLIIPKDIDYNELNLNTAIEMIKNKKPKKKFYKRK